MRITGAYKKLGANGFEMVLESDSKAIDECLSDLGITYPLEIEIKRKRKKRSLDANAYAWVLMGNLARKLDTTSEEVYCDLIRGTSAFQIVPIREDLIAKWKDIWTAKGVGWVIDDMGECRNTKGYHNIMCYYGSSTYDTEEMRHLIELIVAECKEQGIETMTPDEIAKLDGIAERNRK